MSVCRERLCAGIAGSAAQKVTTDGNWQITVKWPQVGSDGRSEGVRPFQVQSEDRLDELLKVAGHQRARQGWTQPQRPRGVVESPLQG